MAPSLVWQGCPAARCRALGPIARPPRSAAAIRAVCTTPVRKTVALAHCAHAPPRHRLPPLERPASVPKGRPTGSSRVVCTAVAQFVQDWERRASHSQASSSSSRSESSGEGKRRGASSSEPGSNTHDRRWQGSGDLRQQIEACTSAAELHALLASASGQLDPSTAAAALLTAARGSLAAADDGSGGPWSLANAQGQQLAALMKQLAWRHMGRMQPSELAATAWAATTLDVDDAALLQDVQELAIAQLVHFRPGELVAVLWALAHGSGEVQQRAKLLHRFGELLEGGMALQPLWGPRDLATLVWACGMLGFAHPKLLSEALAACRALISGFTTADAARMLHGLALLHHRPEGLVTPLSEHLQSRLRECSDPDDLTVLLVALGKLQMEPESSFLRAAAAQAVRLLKNSQPRHVANQAWAFARLSYRPNSGSFMQKSASDALARRQEYGVEHLSTMLWVWARWAYKPPGSTLAEVARQVAAEVQTASTQALLNALWALGTLLGEHERGALQTAMIAAALPDAQACGTAAALELARRSDSLSARELAGALVSLALLDVQGLPKAPQRQLQLACAPLLRDLAPAEIAKLGWALARLGWREERLLSALAQAAELRMKSLSPQCLAQLAWALAVLGFRDSELMASLTQASVLQLKRFEPLDRARLLFAYASVPPARHGPLEHALLSKLLGQTDAAQLPRMGTSAVAALLWSCARLKLAPKLPLVHAAAQYVLRNASHYSARQMRQIGCSLVRLSYNEPHMLQRIGEYAAADDSSPDE